MKTKVLIIEDNPYKFFTTKQLLETQLNMKVSVVDAPKAHQLAKVASELSPDLIVFRPGGVMDLLMHMKKRKTNRRNTEITLMVTQEVDDHMARHFQDFLARYMKRLAKVA